ncbi:homeobox protein [Anaeramoeba flamelloides]|uniref:Homeobox protein n=1 Tax=Anaeramoeba flamelloides TaxID=1746091 RepID=A0AAV8A5J4_9EUKA|nr:homeobox protein [Anaeramoeba flamelloides]
MNNYFPKQPNGWDWKMNSIPSQIKNEQPNIQTNDQMQINNQMIKFEDFTQPQQPQQFQERQIHQKQQKQQELQQTQQKKLLKFKENYQQQMLLMGLDKPVNKNIHKNQFYKNAQQQVQDQDQDQQKTEQQPLSEKNAFMFNGNNGNGENQRGTLEASSKLEKNMLPNGLEKLTPDQYFDELSIFCKNFKERINQLNLLPRFQSINERKRIHNANSKENDQPLVPNTLDEKKQKASPEISQKKKKSKYNSNSFISNEYEEEDGNGDEFGEQTDESDKEYHNTTPIKKIKYKTKTKAKHKDKIKTKSSRQPKYTTKLKKTKKTLPKPKSKSNNKPRVNDNAKPKSRPNFSKPVVKILKEWFDSHSEHPFPTKIEKNILVDKTQLTLKQVNNWFINARRRRKPKDLDQNKNQKSKKANK